LIPGSLSFASLVVGAEEGKGERAWDRGFYKAPVFASVHNMTRHSRPFIRDDAKIT